MEKITDLNLLLTDAERRRQKHAQRFKAFGTHALIFTAAYSATHATFSVAEAVAERMERDDRVAALVESYEDAEIALVPFGMDTDDATALGEDLEVQFNELSDGIITIDVEVVEPTEAALEAYEGKNDDNCVDSSNYEVYGSFIAESEMESLAEYDKILALNDEPSCDNGLLGVAAFNTRYGEVFDVTNGWEPYEANGQEQAIYEATEYGSKKVGDVYSPVMTAAHELYHLYGLGHSGTMQLKPEHYEDHVSLVVEGHRGESPLKTVDLAEMVGQRYYEEYGNYDVMGSAMHRAGTGLNPIQRYVLETPLRNDGLGTETIRLDASENPAEIDVKKDRDTFAAVTLSEKFKIGDDIETSELAFIPYYSPSNGEFMGIDAYAILDGGDQALIDMVFNYIDEETAVTLKAGNDEIEVRIDYDAMKVTITKK